MFGPTTKKALALSLLAGALASCDSGTGPGEEAQFDADAALADYEALDVLMTSEAMARFRAMSAGISFQAIAPDAAPVLELPGELGDLGDAPVRRAAATGLARITGELAEGAVDSPIISGFNRGKTFAFDPDLDRYAWDQDREGAPATGVRFILYERGLDGRPDPAAEVGYADLIDEGDDSVEDIALRLVVVEGTDTILEYATTLDVMDQSGQITAAGHLRGEGEQLDFDILVTGSEADGEETVDIQFAIGIASRDFLITGAVSGVENDSGEGGEVDLLVRHGDDSFQVDVTGSEESIDGTFLLNGDLFATVSGDPDDPTFTGATGDPLTLPEMLVLGHIVDSTEDVFDFWEDLLDPVDELILIAIIL